MLRIETALTVDENFLEEVYKIDKIVYSEEFCGKKENLYNRLLACKDSFLLVYDREKLIGYINFFPVNQQLNDDMINRNDKTMRDDDISPEEIHDWSDKNHIFVISIAILPDYRKGEAIKLLSNSFLEFLRNKAENGHVITSISGYAISLGGVKFLKRFHATLLKETDDNHHFFYATDDDVAKLLENGLFLNDYVKSYKDDIFFFLPMTSDGKNSRFEKIINSNKRKCSDSEDFDYTPLEDLSKLEFGDLYCKCINRHVEYECNGDTFKSSNIKRIYLGAFSLACYDDDYDGIPLDTEEAHIFITAHKYTGIYVITLAIMGNLYDPSQLIDQMSTDHLEILDPETNKYISVEEYFSNKFDLVLCGESKCVICLEKEPDNDLELPYLLSGECMNSKHIDYRIRPEHRQKLTECRAIYDYYDSYISRSVIAFVFNNYSDDIAVRMTTEASELFIVEIVLFQNTAVLRTNRQVVDNLCHNDSISNEEINELYVEFAKTMPFWNKDIFKYPFSQAEADEVIKSFGISNTLENYHRNQQFLDRLIELKSNIEIEKSDKMMNDILFFLSFVQSSSVFLAAVLWIYFFVTGNHPSLTGEPLVRILCVSIIFVITVMIYFSSRFKKAIIKFKQKHKKNKPRS